MIKALIFDMGGVLFDLDLNKGIESFRTRTGYEDIKEAFDPYHPKGIVGAMEAGEISADEFLDICVSHSRPGTTRETARQCFLSIVGDLAAEKAALIKELSSKYELYILSNNNPLAIKYCGDMMRDAGIALETTFKKVFFSCEMRVCKPKPEIFKRAIDEIGCPPQQMLFIDDSSVNVEAARAEGINAIRYIQGSDLRAALEAALRELAV